MKTVKINKNCYNKIMIEKDSKVWAHITGGITKTSCDNLTIAINVVRYYLWKALEITKHITMWKQF